MKRAAAVPAPPGRRAGRSSRRPRLATAESRSRILAHLPGTLPKRRGLYHFACLVSESLTCSTTSGRKERPATIAPVQQDRVAQRAQRKPRQDPRAHCSCIFDGSQDALACAGGADAAVDWRRSDWGPDSQALTGPGSIRCCRNRQFAPLVCDGFVAAEYLRAASQHMGVYRPGSEDIRSCTAPPPPWLTLPCGVRSTTRAFTCRCLRAA